MTVIFYPEGEEDEAVYIPVEPCDPFVEAIRTAVAIGAEIVFTDPDMGERPHLPDSYPDSYALHSITLAQYVESYRVYPQERSDELEHHADGIAWKLQGTDPLAAGDRCAVVEPAGPVAGCDGASAGSADDSREPRSGWSC